MANHLLLAEPVVSMIGGRLIGRQECVVGPDAIDYVSKLHVPYAFITTTGVRAYHGLVCATSDQAMLKSAMIRAAERVIVLADSEKIERDSVRLFATFDEVDVLITDAEPKNKKFVQDLAAHNVELLIAGHQQ